MSKSDGGNVVTNLVGETLGKRAEAGVAARVSGVRAFDFSLRRGGYAGRPTPSSHRGRRPYR